ncbi:DNA polymerase III subunit gamma/tau [Calditerrivibrio sp.]|uniref:DNA polymerase III subunit gamma/tau n=1 Tax=Calditerrivibrio sp. TaxID=2792612 RepID=UPI003D107157
MQRYKALARKYRPQNFDEIVGQEFVVKTLKNAIELGRISHAYLFTGPRGIGKTTAARVFAKAVNCLNPIGVNPCNQCSNCIEINNGTSVDVIEIDGASNRKVEEARNIRENVRILPINNKYKVYIIDEVHMLTEEAFNALLKTLEEPPDYVIFILATTDAHKIPMTILSRCQKYDFKKIPNNYMRDYLLSIMEKEGISCDNDSLNLIIRNSDGCMRDALSLIDQLVAFTGGNITYENTSEILDLSEQKLADDIFEGIVNGDTNNLFDLIDEFSRKGIDYQFALETFITHTRNLLHGLTGGFSDKTLTRDEIDFYEGLKPKLNLNKLFGIFQIFQKTLSEMRYLQMEKYIFEFGVFKAANIDKLIPTDQIPTITVREPDKSEYNVNKPSAAHPPALSDIQKTWKGFIKHLETINPAIAAQCGYGSISEMNNKYILSFSEKDKFYYNMLTKPEKKQILEKNFKSYFGNDKDISIVLENNIEKKSLVKTESEIRSFQDELLKKEVENNPVIKKFIQVFDAEIEKIEQIDNKNK